MIQIDSEFKNLIPPLSPEERQGLESSLLKEGCRDALVLWGDILIDGHNRYEICTKHNIPYKTVQREFESREAVIEWIILNQFGRRNLPAHERARLALRLKPVIAEKAKEQQGERTDICQNSDRSSIDTKRELAKLAGVSHDTIAKSVAINGAEALVREIYYHGKWWLQNRKRTAKQVTDAFINKVNKDLNNPNNW